jgi:ATP synthase mitochondrial F1 complex assembly factor 2
MTSNSYIITLDGRTIKTPYRNVLAVPTPALAFLVANEFNRQIKHLKTGEMPMLALCRTAVDADIEGHLADHLRHSIYEYLKTDTLLFVDDTFGKEHKQLSMPLINNFSKWFEMEVQPSTSIDSPHVVINNKFV